MPKGEIVLIPAFGMMADESAAFDMDNRSMQGSVEKDDTAIIGTFKARIIAGL